MQRCCILSGAALECRLVVPCPECSFYCDFISSFPYLRLIHIQLRRPVDKHRYVLFYNFVLLIPFKSHDFYAMLYFIVFFVLYTMRYTMLSAISHISTLCNNYNFKLILCCDVLGMAERLFYDRRETISWWSSYWPPGEFRLATPFLFCVIGYLFILWNVWSYMIQVLYDFYILHLSHHHYV